MGKTIIVFGILLLVVFAVGAMILVYDDVEGREVNVGVILPLSGTAAYYGEASQRGVTIAREELASAYPDLKINLFYEDSMYAPKEGVSGYQKLREQQDIDAVITAASHVSLAIQPIAEEDNILQMAIFSSAGGYTTPDDLSFRVSARSELEAAALANLIAEEQYRRLGALYLNNDFGVSFKEALAGELRKRGSTFAIVAEEAYRLEEKDFRTSLLKIREQNPDAVFMVGTAGHYALILKQARELGLAVPFVSMRSAEDPVLLKNAGDLANGLVYTYPFDAEKSTKEIKNFVNAFKARYNEVPDAYAAEGYEGTKLVGLAFAECGKDYACIQEYLTTLEGYNSLFGKLSFDEYGDVRYGFFYKTVNDGAFVILQ